MKSLLEALREIDPTARIDAMIGHDTYDILCAPEHADACVAVLRVWLEETSPVTLRSLLDPE